jgi:hypothetical protein
MTPSPSTSPLQRVIDEQKRLLDQPDNESRYSYEFEKSPKYILSHTDGEQIGRQDIQRHDWQERKWMGSRKNKGEKKDAQLVWQLYLLTGRQVHERVDNRGNDEDARQGKTRNRRTNQIESAPGREHCNTTQHHTTQHNGNGNGDSTTDTSPDSTKACPSLSVFLSRLVSKRNKITDKKRKNSRTRILLAVFSSKALLLP